MDKWTGIALAALVAAPAWAQSEGGDPGAAARAAAAARVTGNAALAAGAVPGAPANAATAAATFQQLLSTGESLWAREDWRGAMDIFRQAAQTALGVDPNGYNLALMRWGQSNCMVMFNTARAQMQGNPAGAQPYIDAFLNDPHCASLVRESTLMRQYKGNPDAGRN